MLRQGVLASLVLASATLGGCSRKHVTVADTFPKGSHASPWVLEGEVWSGSLEQAASGLGNEAEQWAELDPERVWLAVYRHDTRTKHKLTVRGWAFSSVEQARRAYDRLHPDGADELEAGDDACWTDDGVLVLWGQMVFEIFGSGQPNRASPEQAVYLLAFIEKKTPAGLPDAPR